MSWDSVFHEGELQAQKLARQEDDAESNSAMIADKMMAGALNFIRQQTMAIFSSADSAGNRWASIVFGPTGFLEPSDRKTLRIATPKSLRDENDPLWTNLASNPSLGVLIIELATRRRIRINGDAVLDDQQILLNVAESFPNCPKYISKRAVEFSSPSTSESPSQIQTGSTIPEFFFHSIERAHALFLATGHAERGNDASHRGGNPGFIELVNENTLRIPDYLGNGLFNTLGNVLTDPRAGILIPFFTEGRQLQLTGTSRVHWNQPDPQGKTGGTNRFVEFTIAKWLARSLPAQLKTSSAELSPYNPIPHP